MTRGDTIREENLPDKLKRTSNMNAEGDFLDIENESLKDRVEQFEKQSIIKALQNARGVKKKAANILGISPRNLSYFIKKYNM
jgi:transcriptional regulator with PAS, ATPase and Fis domain